MVGGEGMACVLVIGGGLAGCVTARELADKGIETLIVEKSPSIGGKVRHYGCKATERCNQCGLCIVGDLWQQVEKHEKIQILTESQVLDVEGSRGDFSIRLASPDGPQVISGVSDIVVSVGFDTFSLESAASMEYEPDQGIISGNQLERLLAARGRHGVFTRPPASIGFIQCFGSRDIQEKAAYCSRVCCGYSTRAARVLRQYHPDMKISFFYMDLQELEGEARYKQLLEEQFEFIRSRPIRILPGRPNRVLYEKPGSGELLEQEFDMLVLPEGIHPSEDGQRLAEICRLGFDRNGFLKYAADPRLSGIHVAGCVSGPKKIPEVFYEGLQVAWEISGGIL
jgi:heterodisulfide reductase subunit A